MNKKLLGYINSGNVIKFYKSKEWREKRAEIVKRDNNECQHCKARGKFSKVECVHHKKHLRHYPMLALTSSNLVSLCNVCHNIEHPEKFNNNKVDKFENEERW